jgi:F-type H+-transporting ATPase subunit epsilon
MAKEKFLNVEIITPQKVAYSGAAASVTVPGAQSPFQILFNHAPIVSSLEAGIVKIEDEKSVKTYYATSGGFVEVRKNQVAVLVESAENAANIDVAKCLEELNQAKQKLEAAHDAVVAEGLKKKVVEIENKIKAAKYLKERN